MHLLSDYSKRETKIAMGVSICLAQGVVLLGMFLLEQVWPCWRKLITMGMGFETLLLAPLTEVFTAFPLPFSSEKKESLGSPVMLSLHSPTHPHTQTYPYYPLLPGTLLKSLQDKAHPLLLRPDNKDQIGD